MRFPRLAGALCAGALVAGLGAVPAPADEGRAAVHWVGTWAASPQGGGPGQDRPSIADRTLRQIVHTTVGGDLVRIRLTNAHGTAPLVIGESHLALRGSGAAIRPGTDRRLTFGGSPRVTIAPGAEVASDPTVLRVPEAADLAISLYVLGPTGAPTYHALSMQTNYTSPPGNFAGAVDMPVGETFCWTIPPRPCIAPWYFLAGVDVLRPGRAGAIVAFGDSLTDGDSSGDTSAVDRNARWPDLLARRLNAPVGNDREVGVLNAGIAGNRVLGAGDSALRRLDRDVLTQPGVRWVVFFEGINDLYNRRATAADLIPAYQQIIQRTHARGLPIYGGTLTPAGFTDTREAERLAVNTWIRTSGQFDAVLDFDAAVRDPANPAFSRPAYDGGDHLHFTVAGYQALASSIDLSLFGIRSTIIAADHPDIRYQGRWGRLGGTMATVNSGSGAVLRFTGQHLAATFDQTTVTHPPQIYVRIDRGNPVLYTVDRNLIDLTARPLSRGGIHTLEITVKDVDERANRWNPPLRSGLLLTGFRLDPDAITLPPPAPEDRRIEFLGDSITQGVRAVGPEIGVTGSDATKGYAWLTGRALRADFRQVGFGAQGIGRSGGGQVPPAAQALLFNFAGSPIDPAYAPHAIVVNQGTNDALGAADPAPFQAAYLDYLRRIRATWPTAWIFVMRPLGGYFAHEIATAATAVDHTVYVDTAGWLTATDYTDGLHPTYAGHLRVAHRLAPILAARLGWTTADVPDPRTEPLAVPAFEPAPSSDEWRTVSLPPGTRLRLPAAAEDLFVYVRPDLAAGTEYDARLSVTQGGHTHTAEADGLPHLPFIPWNRLHVNLSGNTPVTGISVSLRVEGSSNSGRLSFQVDDLGWTNVHDG
jgi:lysophospholipase L1-like esterase